MKGSRVQTYKPGPGQQSTAGQISAGWRASPYVPGYDTEATVNPEDLGYPATPEETQTYLRHQQKRARMSLAKVDGNITKTDAERIKAARAKRERRARR